MWCRFSVKGRLKAFSQIKMHRNRKTDETAHERETLAAKKPNAVIEFECNEMNLTISQRPIPQPFNIPGNAQKPQLSPFRAPV
jgi:hypothetical protein